MHGAPKYGPGDTHLDYANPDAPKGGTLVQGASGTFDTLNPYSIKGKAAKGLNLVYDRLMQRVWDEPFTMYPLIAERVEIPEDRSTLTVHINPTARFHDGSPITADDVIFSYQTLKESGRPNMRRVYALAETVEKIDERTVKFSFSEDRDAETVMIFAMMPVLSKKWWSGRAFDSAVLEEPLLNGPYRIKEVDPGRRIVYERVDDYWAKDLLTSRGHFNFDTIIYDYFRDDTVAFEAFKAGDVMLRREWDAGKWASGYDFSSANEGVVTLAELPHGRPERVNAFIFNTRRPPFDDIRVRKALNLLLDFEWINESLFHGMYKRVDSFFPNSELAFHAGNKENAVVTQNQRQRMRAANALLNEAGWTVEDGRRMKNGQPFSFEIILGNPNDEKIALAFKRSLDRMGITANIRVLDSAQYLARLNEYDFDMTLYYWLSSLSPGTEQYLYWSCEAANQPARWNYAGICDPEIDALAKSIAHAGTRKELIEKTRALDQKLWEGQYIIPLWYAGRDFAAYWAPVKRPGTTPLYGMVIETWWSEGAD